MSKSREKVRDFNQVYTVGIQCNARYLHMITTYLPLEAVAEASKDKKPIGNGCEIELTWKSMDFRFKWFQFQLISDSIDLISNPLPRWLTRYSIGFSDQLATEVCQYVWPWCSKTKRFCKTSFENKTFLGDFLQKQSCDDQKRSVSARLPWKMTWWPDTWPQNCNAF